MYTCMCGVCNVTYLTTIPSPFNLLVYGRGGVCVHGEREDVCIRKGWSVRAWGEGGCVYGRGECVCTG